MIKGLLLMVTIAIVSGVTILDKALLTSYDVPLEECSILRNGVKRPMSDPRKCASIYPLVPCGYLYPVTDPASHTDTSLDYMVSDRCYSGDLKAYAVLCSSQCALCCDTPAFNCTNKHSPEQCDVIEQLDLCEAPGMEDYVSYFCRGTCGLCEKPEFDKPIGEDCYEHCDKLFGLVPCTVPFMQINCRDTCFFLLDDQYNDATGGDEEEAAEVPLVVTKRPEIYETGPPLIADDQ